MDVGVLRMPQGGEVHLTCDDAAAVLVPKTRLLSFQICWLVVCLFLFQHSHSNIQFIIDVDLVRILTKNEF